MDVLRRVSIRKMLKVDRELISNLLQLYIYDLEAAGVVGVKVDHRSGVYAYPSLDSLFEDVARCPLGIYLDEMPIGFVLLFEALQADIDYEITEFFVKRAYRRKGIGAKALTLLADKYRGSYIVHAVPENIGAVKFWVSVIQNSESIISEGDFNDGCDGARWKFSFG